jgi:hypothetical protein
MAGFNGLGMHLGVLSRGVSTAAGHGELRAGVGRMASR